MCKLVISGYYGFGNAGDEALLAAILEALLEVEPSADITVISGNPEMTKQVHGIKAIGRFDIPGMYRAISNCDMVISGGGSLLQDVTSARSLYYYLSIITLANLLGKKVMVYAQGIGPLRGSLARQTVKNVLNQVQSITVRDHASKEELLRLGVRKPSITVTADAVLGMHPVDTAIGNRLLEPYGVSGVKPKIGISVRSWKEYREYRHVLASALDTIYDATGAEILFIPMQHPEDTKEARDIASAMKSPCIVLDRTFHTTELLSLTGCMDVVIGIRLHALVFSALMETPCLGISYDPKIDNFLSMIGESPLGSMEQMEESRIVRAVLSLLERPSYGPESLQLIRQLRHKSLENARIALAMLHTR